MDTVSYAVANIILLIVGAVGSLAFAALADLLITGAFWWVFGALFVFWAYVVIEYVCVEIAHERAREKQSDDY
jgi:uncharacterized Tic20 family protein